MADASDANAQVGQGGALSDLVSTQKGGVQTLAVVAKSLANAMPGATASTSPVVTGLNTVTTAPTVAVAPNQFRHGIVFHNPGSNNTIYIYPSSITTVPTTSLLGGSFAIATGSTITFSPSTFPNVNCGWSAFCLTTTVQPLTIAEFY